MAARWDFILTLASLVCLLGTDFAWNDAVLARKESDVSGIRLEVVTASSDFVLTEAEDSADIQLRVSYAGEENTGISLYDCVAMSEAGDEKVQLTDSKGCPPHKSPMGCMKAGKNGTVVSPTFRLSSLADAGLVNITCSWEPCLSPNHPKCLDRCSFFTTHRSDRGNTRAAGRSRPRREGDESAGRRSRPPREGDGSAGRRHISTTIRVLPSHVRRVQRPNPGHHMHHTADGHMASPQLSQMDPRYRHDTMTVQTSPLLYLNPITCSVLLLVLAIFLGLFVSFVRSLRHSVEDIKREIDVQRARDKFLIA